MGRAKQTHGTVLLVAVTSVLTIGLHALGSVPALAIDFSDITSWVSASAPEYIVGALLRVVGIVMGYWILLSTSLYVLVSRRAAGRPRWVKLITLPFVRRIVDRTLATALAASIVATPLSPALADERAVPPPVVYEASEDGIPVPHVRSAPTSTDAPSDPSADAPLPAAPIPVPALPTVPGDPVGPTLAVERRVTYAVTPGDNLWDIAAAHVAATEAGEGEVSTYWRQLVDLNRETLRSGDPNLIYPGELLTLPEIGNP